ncbi:hypothetical protein T484DRAFT_1832352, partial [Baffinella frigidus]
DGNNAAGGGCTYNEKRKEGLPSRSIDNMLLWTMFSLIGETYPEPKQIGRVAAKSMVAVWLWTTLSLIGENYPEPKQICGAVCCLRGKQDRVSVWTRDGENEEKWGPVKAEFRKALQNACQVIEPNKVLADRDIEFNPHNEQVLADRDIEFNPHNEQVKKALTGSKGRR